ncbi:MAG UNVERIFIED_CONTAM: hypothetical protein LVR18_40140 [Planctomycetaceae bacterium]
MAGRWRLIEQGNLRVATAFDGDSQTGWAVYEGKPIDREHAAGFSCCAEAVQVMSGDQLMVRLAARFAAHQS